MQGREPLQDARQKRTRRALFAALDELLTERPYAQINVTDLAARAGIGRQTFYRHYESIDAMLRERLERALARQLETASGTVSADPRDWFRRVALFAFAQAQVQPRVSRAILRGDAGADTLQLFRTQIMALWAAAPGRDAAPPMPANLRPYVASFHAGAICAVLLQWLEAGCSPDAETMSELFTTLAQGRVGKQGADR